jgi:hypothetical protein
MTATFNPKSEKRLVGAYLLHSTVCAALYVVQLSSDPFLVSHGRNPEAVLTIPPENCD